MKTIFILNYLLMVCYVLPAQKLHIDGFIGTGYLQTNDKDANGIISSKEIWQHNKASVAIGIYKHVFVGASLLNMQITYSDFFTNPITTVYNNPSALLYYKTNSKNKFNLDAGIEICRTNYDRTASSIPIIGKYGNNLGNNIGINYRVWKNFHITAQNYILWNISKEKLYFDGPIFNVVFGIKYCNDWEEDN